MKTVLITGGTGFIGRHLCADLLADDWQVEVATRDAERAAAVLPAAIRPVETFTTATPARVVVNLAGEDIVAGRWTEARKRELRESRLRVTRDLTDTIGNWPTPPAVLVSGSAVGYYGARGEEVIGENEPPGDEFQSELCVAWEQAARRVEGIGVRVCRIRTGLVLDSREGALSKMITPFRFGLGGHIASGRQFLPWIHIRDEVRAIRFLMEHEDCVGAFNLTAPEPVTNREFSATLARVLHRPMFTRMPGALLNLVMGQRARLIVTGQRVIPDALDRAGFRFEFETLQSALTDLLVDNPRREMAH